MTPDEIRQKRFERSFRGYSAKAVEEYLELLANSWARMQEQEKKHLALVSQILLYQALISRRQELKQNELFSYLVDEKE